MKKPVRNLVLLLSSNLVTIGSALAGSLPADQTNPTCIKIRANIRNDFVSGVVKNGVAIQKLKDFLHVKMKLQTERDELKALIARGNANDATKQKLKDDETAIFDGGEHLCIAIRHASDKADKYEDQVRENGCSSASGEVSVMQKAVEPWLRHYEANCAIDNKLRENNDDE